MKIRKCSARVGEAIGGKPWRETAVRLTRRHTPAASLTFPTDLTKSSDPQSMALYLFKCYMKHILYSLPGFSRRKEL